MHTLTSSFGASILDNKSKNFNYKGFYLKLKGENSDGKLKIIKRGDEKRD